jgi:zinc protease
MTIREHRLKNGMLVLAIERRGHPVVTSMVWYRVGSRDESTGITGVSHFLEHMLFKGTRNIAKGEIDAVTARLGGTNNAFTDYDYTAYYFNFASDRWMTAFAIEADRMQHCILDEAEFEKERRVVLEEMRMGEDDPWRDLAETVSSAIFHVHPYHHPVIGWKHDVENLRIEQMRNYYESHYRPSNAIAVVAGDVRARDVFRAAKRYFGKLKSSDAPARSCVAEPSQRGPRNVVIERDSPVRRLMVGYRGTRCATREDYALDVLGAALASGRSSRLYKKLVKEERVAVHVSAENEARLDPGVFWLVVEAQDGVGERAVARALFGEIDRIRKATLTAREMARAKRLILAGQAMAQESVSDLADRVGRMEVLHSWRYVKDYRKKIGQVTARDVLAVAREVLDERNRTIGWAVPGPDSTRRGSRRIHGVADRRSRRAGRRLAIEPVSVPSKTKFKIPPRSGPPPVVRLNYVREVLENGLVVLATANGTAPTVSLVAYVHLGSACEPERLAGLENLTGSLLEEGTRNFSGDELALAIEESGGFIESGSRGVTGSAIAMELPLLAELTAEMLIRPRFDASAFSRVRDEIVSDLVADEDDLRGRALRQLRELIYGSHALHRPPEGYIHTVKKITRRDVVAFHREWYCPSRTMVSISGDIDPHDAVAAIRKQFSHWKAPAHPHPDPGRIPPPKSREVLDRLQREQVHIALGHLGIRRDNPDFYALLVMDHVLGTGSGFTDRISRKIRDEEGLAYTVSANITNTAGREPGQFIAYLSTEPKNAKYAKNALVREIRGIVARPPTEQEVRDAKDYLIGSFPLTLERNGSRALALASVERHGLGADYFEKYTERIEAVSCADVAAAAKKYLFPGRLAAVQVGPVG